MKKNIRAVWLVVLLCIVLPCAVCVKKAAADNTYAYTLIYHESETGGDTVTETGWYNGAGRATTDYATFGWNQAGRRFDGWRLYRDSDHSYMLLDEEKVGHWMQLNADGTVPEGYHFPNYENKHTFGSPAKVSGDTVHLYAQWKTSGFTLVYHEDNNSTGTVGAYIPYGNPDNIKAKTIQELGYSTEGRSFLGWRLKRDMDGKWLIRPVGDTNAVWTTLENGQLPSGYEYVTYGNAPVFKTPATEGNVHMYAQWLNISDMDVTDPYFGANGSDRLSDRNAIQKALDMGKTSSTTITVRIPAGTYYLSDPLVIYSDTNLLLDTNAKLVLQDSTDMMLTNASANGSQPGGYGRSSNITIQGGTWDGNGTSGDHSTNLIYIAHANNVTISNVNMINCCANHYIELVAVSNGSITNSRFADFYLAKADGYESYLSTADVELEDKTGAIGSVTSEAIQL
ncbi:MAG: hypothetical protein J6T47_01410, partial [Lachnospiraceae bacterium]|nr:hypothetical protein [Lachnospiraceae bacterium]